jgi:hypothetical protein
LGIGSTTCRHALYSRCRVPVTDVKRICILPCIVLLASIRSKTGNLGENKQIMGAI